jgi:hypothetical protein
LLFAFQLFCLTPLSKLPLRHGGVTIVFNLYTQKPLDQFLSFSLMPLALFFFVLLFFFKMWIHMLLNKKHMSLGVYTQIILKRGTLYYIVKYLLTI